ncbi:hypothetical protein ACJJTC_002154 [Scirpophaga incertulas]
MSTIMKLKRKPKKITNMLTSFIIIENFFCISRAFLIEKKRTKYFCNFVFFAVVALVVSAFIYDATNSEDSSSATLSIIETVLIVETIILSFSAIYASKSFEIFNALDDMCDFDKKSVSKYQSEVFSATVITIAATIFDSIGLTLNSFKLSALLILFIGSAAHDAELNFYALLIRSINLRLTNLCKESPNVGSKIYGHILITTTNMGHDFTLGVIVMLVVTFLKTIILTVYIMLFNTLSTTVTLYVVCREIKSLYTLCVLCSAASETTDICRAISFDLTKKLIDETNTQRSMKSNHHKILTRWLSSVTSERPVYLSGRLLNIDFALPLLLIDLSINYLLIILQVGSNILYIKI